MSFRVGQKVTRVRRPELEDIIPSAPPPYQIEIGRVLIVREIDFRAIGLPGHEVPALRFEEIRRPSKMSTVGWWESAYDSRFFRPVVERKTDISVFTKILDGTRELITHD